MALVPASELASLRLWQQRARELPPGNTLVVLPGDNIKMLEVGRRIRRTLEQQGRQLQIATVPSTPSPLARRA